MGGIGPRLVVIGTTGSGKSTLAARLATRLGCPLIELDELHWRENWTPAPLEEFRRDVTAATDAEAWVAAGNYSKVRDIVWGRADTLVWLDYPYPVVFTRLFRRTVGRVVSQEPFYHGNTERFRTAFCSRESLFVWQLQTHWRHRRQYPQLLQEPEFGHLRIVRLRSPRQAARWLAGLSRSLNGGT